MIKIAKISENNYVENIFLISDENKNRIEDFIKNDLKIDGLCVEINEKNSKNFECGVDFFYDKENNIFCKEKPQPWFVFDENKKEWICPEHIDKETGQEKTERQVLYENILNKIPKKIVYPDRG